MFDKDKRHYRQTPRTIHEAFGAYHRFDIAVCRKHERLCAFVGVIVVGVIYGIMFAS